MTLKKRFVYTYIGIAAASLIGLFARSIVFPDWSFNKHLWVTGINFLLLAVVIEAHLLLHFTLNKLLPFEKGLVRRIIPQLLISAGVVKLIHYLLFPHVSQALGFENDSMFFVLTTLALVLMSVLINSILIASFFFVRWRETALKTGRLEKEKAQVQFEGLKNQLNPHFLFNSMASLNSLIKENPELASKYLQHLSKVYRYVLQHDSGSTVPLSTEIEFLQNYIFLLKTRFENMVEVKIEIDPEAMYLKIVPVTLQNLFENAIKHNMITENSPLKINIHTQNNYLVVENNLQPKKLVETSNGMGLQKLKSLYQYLDATPLVVESDREKFRVKIPLLH
ncbi:MAG TPA: histidine kinase [Flavobacteriales bacterium]|nr:histidine kinase [Flavobacteriales bacterium]